MPDGKKVLIAEDDKYMVEMYKEYFQYSKVAKQCEFSYTNNVKTTLDALDNEKFDIMLLDLGLEDISPPPGLKILEEYAKKISTKIIVVSAYTDLVDQCIALGAVEFVLKPVKLSNLMEVLKRNF